MDERFERIRALDQRFILDTYRRLPVAFVRGSGSWLYDTSGKKYLDLVGGLGAVILGHARPEVVEAVRKQAGRLFHTTNLYYIEPQARLARVLSESVFEGQAFFCNSGAEANEGAFKLARKYHFEKGKPRSKFVSAFGSFHGRTFATLSATGQPQKWLPFMPVFQGFSHVVYNDIEALEREVDENTAALVLEPIQGEAGVFPAEREFLRAARRVCDSTGALLILDEVQTGLGRTGRMLACEHYEVKPDILTLAKGLGNGIPIGVFIASEKCQSAFSPGDHGSTFGGGFIACEAALATMRLLVDEELAARADETGRYLRLLLEEIAKEVSLVREIRGKGLMLAVQLDADIARDVVLSCLERGVLVNDVNPSSIRLLPPLTVSREELDQGMSVLGEVIREFSGRD